MRSSKERDVLFLQLSLFLISNPVNITCTLRLKFRWWGDDDSSLDASYDHNDAMVMCGGASL